MLPDVRVSALGTDAVVDGCLASGAELAWQRLTALLPVGRAGGLATATQQLAAADRLGG